VPAVRADAWEPAGGETTRDAAASQRAQSKGAQARAWRQAGPAPARRAEGTEQSARWVTGYSVEGRRLGAPGAWAAQLALEVLRRAWARDRAKRPDPNRP
jgi:hypothetical protein